jgi:hypothetical protein
MMFPICFTLILGIFHKVPIYLVFNYVWQKNLLLVFWTFQELQDLKKGQGQGVRLTYFDTHPTRQSRAPEDQGGGNGIPPHDTEVWPRGTGSFRPLNSVCTKLHATPRV